MRTNYVLIDFENLQPELLEALDLPHFRVIVFVGANQAKVSLDFAAMLQRLGERGRYIRISGSGRNALDFHVAFYMGELEAKEPGSFFHLITGDKGFEPLQQHLRDRKVFMRTYKTVADIPHVKAARSKSLPAKVEFVRDTLTERTQGRPATVKRAGRGGGVRRGQRAAIHRLAGHQRNQGQLCSLTTARCPRRATGGPLCVG